MSGEAKPVSTVAGGYPAVMHYWPSSRSAWLAGPGGGAATEGCTSTLEKRRTPTALPQRSQRSQRKAKA